MRLRALAAGLVLMVLSALVFTTGAGPGAAPGPSSPAPQPAAPPRGFAPDPPLPLRNVFEFGEDVIPPAASMPRSLRPPVEDPAPSLDVEEQPIHPVRLVGFVRRGGGVKAALSLWGSVYLLAVGEEAEGYRLLAADEDSGVRIQGPDGAVLTLPPAS